MKAEHFKILTAIEAATQVLSRSFRNQALLRNINSVMWAQLSNICKEEIGQDLSSCGGCSHSRTLDRLKRLAEAWYKEGERIKKEAAEKEKEAAKAEADKKKAEKAEKKRGRSAKEEE